MNGCIDMHGRHIAPISTDDVERPTDDGRVPGPPENCSPLAAPRGLSDGYGMPRCETCRVRWSCLDSVIALGPFANPRCEMAVMPKQQPLRGLAVDILAVLRIQDGLTCGEILAELKATSPRRTAAGSFSNAVESLTARGLVTVEKRLPRFVYWLTREEATT